MNNAVYNISLDLHAVGSQLTLTAKAYDTARTIRCTLTENGKPYTISEGCYAAFTAKKPDGNVLFNATTIDDAINYEFTVNTVNAPGEVECEIRLYDGNGKLITSPRFSILVDDTVYHDGDVIESASEYTALTKLMDMVVSTLGEIPSPVLYGMAQNLSGEQKEQARKNIGAASVKDLEAKQTFLPVAKGTSTDGIDYVATDEASETTLPVVSVANSVEHISAEGKGRQIVFIPYETNMTNSPTLQINGGQVIPIRMRAPKNQGSSESSPDATLPVPVGVLMRGVPYTMTFCGKYWLVDSLIDIHADEIGNTVRFEAQTLTDKQKKLARENIGAVSEDELKNAVKNASSRTTINVNLISENWEQIEDELFEQTVSTQILDDIDRDEDVLLQCCPEPKSIAAWNLYGIQCMNATNESLTFQAQTQPAENENIGVIIAVWR